MNDALSILIVGEDEVLIALGYVLKPASIPDLKPLINSVRKEE